MFLRNPYGFIIVTQENADSHLIASIQKLQTLKNPVTETAKPEPFIPSGKSPGTIAHTLPVNPVRIQKSAFKHFITSPFAPTDKPTSSHLSYASS
jgi:hypothetical protein